MTQVIIRSAAERSWQAWAACRDFDPGLFHTPGSPRPGLALCAQCPGRECCLWFTLSYEERSGYHYGIWGGTTAAERARFARLLPAGFAARAYRASVAFWRHRLDSRAVA